VIAFEPSERERRRLKRHVRVNRCWNVTVEECALGDEVGEADLFVVEGWEDWCNSLRRPTVKEQTKTIRVCVERLDDVLWRLEIDKVDFIKLDSEGAELSVLQGARELLRGASRPVILAELQDVRTLPWRPDGSLHAAATDLESYDANLVAVPAERVGEIQRRVEANA
jgi:FkbM family methyltransferase